MKIFEKSLKIKLTVIIFFLLLVSTIIIGIWFFSTEKNTSKAATILGSLCTGLIVAIIQFIISWQDYNETEKLKKLELIKVLYDRDNRSFYEDYISKAKKKIDMMGVTGSRFFRDFADCSSNATSNAKVLLQVLDKGIKVRILLPNEKFVDKNKKSDVETSKKYVEEIKKKYDSLLEVKYFDHTPTHSIFNVDQSCIVGPVFPELESKYTPALYLRNSSPIAEKYIDYFENEWKKAKELE